MAAGCAALAVVILASFLRPSGPALVDILTATTDLPAGSTLTAEDISTQPFPADHIPPGAFTDTTQLIGRLLAAPMAQGEAVTQTRLMSVGPRADGLHTVPVRLADAEMADLLAPGAIIDLVLPMVTPAVPSPVRSSPRVRGSSRCRAAPGRGHSAHPRVPPVALSSSRPIAALLWHSPRSA